MSNRHKIKRVDWGARCRDAAENDPKLIHQPIPKLSAWLREQTAALPLRRLCDELFTCGHLRAEDVGFHALWDPDWIGCYSCRRLRNANLTREQDQTCDRCGTVVETIWPMTLYPSRLAEDFGELFGLPQIVVSLGLCADCVRDEGVDPD